MMKKSAAGGAKCIRCPHRSITYLYQEVSIRAEEDTDDAPNQGREDDDWDLRQGRDQAGGDLALPRSASDSKERILSLSNSRLPESL